MKGRYPFTNRWSLDKKDQLQSYDLGEHILHGRLPPNARLRQLTGPPHRHYNTRVRQRRLIRYLFSPLRCPCAQTRRVVDLQPVRIHSSRCYAQRLHCCSAMQLGPRLLLYYFHIQYTHYFRGPMAKRSPSSMFWVSNYIKFRHVRLMNKPCQRTRLQKHISLKFRCSVSDIHNTVSIEAVYGVACTTTSKFFSTRRGSP
jgi:hypothetical protein